MFENITFFDWLLAIDQKATQIAYTRLPPDCTCIYCQNFRAAISYLPSTFYTILTVIGVQPLHPANVLEYPGETVNLHLYEGWYHAVGHILAAPLSSLNQYGRQPVEASLEVQVTTDLALVPENFPKPVIQIALVLWDFP